MANGCNIAHPLKREGTFQFERFPLELEEAYVKLDERTIIDLIRQTKGYASLVRYYNESNIEESDWTSFFDELTEAKLSDPTLFEKEQKTSPHLALFIAFLRIFGIARENLNQVTKRHLDFYYKTVLRLAPNAAEPDKVAVFFEPEKTATQVKVAKDTVLNAGKDPAGKDLYYQTTSELIVNQAKISEVKTIFLNKNTAGSKVSLHASADACTENLADATGSATGSFHPFGSNANNLATYGFALASPILNLKEGKRRITLVFSGVEKIDRSGLVVEYTSEKGWTEAELAGQSGSTYNSAYLLVKAAPGLPAFSVYNTSVHGGTLQTSHPMLRFLVKNTAAATTVFNNLCNTLKQISAGSIGITVQVSGMKNLVLQGDSGLVDTTKPFQPFGAFPAKNKSTLYIGSNDVFNKYLRSFNLGISWKGLPGNIRKYYSSWQDGLDLLYEGDSISQKKYFDTGQFEYFEPGHPPGKLSVLDNGMWKAMELNVHAGYPAKVYVDPYRTLNNIRGISKTHEFWQNVFNSQSLQDGSLQSDYSYDRIKSYLPTARQGFAKIELQYDFGHKAFPTLFTMVAISNAKNATQKRIPEAPYTPEFDSLSLDYTASTVIDFSQSPENQFFHIQPFGQNEICDQLHAMIPDFEDEGQLLIGIANASQPEVVSIYFQLENNTGNVDKSISDSNKVAWYYLAGNDWVRFDDSAVIENTTNTFTSSGYIKFSLPSEAVSAHSILTDGLVWIMGAVATDSDAYPNLISLATQAVEAVFTDNGNDVSHLEYALPAGSISKLKDRITGIKKVLQPYESFEGRLPEDDREFYTRVSERLRHKNRGWSIWDYERIVLQNFPLVFKAKCISHSNSTYEYAPGEVLIVLLPYITNVSYSNLLQPRLNQSTLQSVADLVRTKTSPFVNLEVINPVYECLQVTCEVKLGSAYGDITYYSAQLITDLQGFIAPWSIDEDAKPSFEGKIYKSQIIDFIEERDYVDYITAFDVVKYLSDGTMVSCDEEISGTAEDVILTSYSTHSITAS